MGWFSADEIVAPAPIVSSEKSEGHHSAQTIALCILSAVAVGYVLLKGLLKLHRQHTEQVAERASRRVVAQV